MKLFFLSFIFSLNSNLFAGIDFSSIDTSGLSIKVSRNSLFELNISREGRTNAEGWWEAPLSPSVLAEKINKILADGGKNEKFEARFYSETVFSEKKVQALLKNSKYIWKYVHDDSNCTIKIVPTSQKPRANREFGNSINGRMFIAPLKGLFSQRMGSDISADLKNGQGDAGEEPKNEQAEFFPEQSYFDEWQNYSFVYVVKIK